MTTQTFASQLLSLPLTLEGKVHLWLTYKDLKLVSTIQFVNNLKNQIKNKKLIRWLYDANLVYIQDTRSSEFVFVSKDTSSTKRASQIMWSEKKEHLMEKEKLFGYPEEAVESFANNKSITVLSTQQHKQYWVPYVRYMVRTKYILKDSRVAQTWADTIRKDVPELATQFEKEMTQAIYK